MCECYFSVCFPDKDAQARSPPMAYATEVKILLFVAVAAQLFIIVQMCACQQRSSNIPLL